MKTAAIHVGCGMADVGCIRSGHRASLYIPHPTSHIPHRRLAASRRGLTFIEVVFAFAMLGMVAAALLGVYGFVISDQARQQRWLGAAEVANRLMLNYLDSPTGMPEAGKVVEHRVGETMLKYRWELLEEQLQLVEPRKDQRDPARETPLRQDRYRNIVVRAWLSEQSGGSQNPEPGTPVATLSRMLDPIAPRNPDSYMAMLGNAGDKERLIQGFLAIGQTTGPAGGSMGFELSTGGLSAQQSLGHGRSRPPNTSALSGGSR